MPNFLKLRAEGDAHTGTVVSCAKATTGKYPGLVFTFDDGNAVEVPESSANRQLGRAKLTVQSVVGCVITISRDHNPDSPDKPYWGLYLNDPQDDGGPDDNPFPPQETGAPPNATRPPVRQNAPQAPKSPNKAGEAERITAAYLDLYDRVKMRVQGADVQQSTATIWICLDKRGLV